MADAQQLRLERAKAYFVAVFRPRPPALVQLQGERQAALHAAIAKALR